MKEVVFLKIQILVNHYKEEESVVRRFLSSLQKQENAEFEVLIYGDGGDKLNEEIFHEYTFPIIYKFCSHDGMCATRSKLMHDSSTEYIMWCDIDDEFYREDGLSSLIKAAEETHADIVFSPYTEEGLIDGEYKYRVLQRDTIRHHGKLFRRSFLEENNIDYDTRTELCGDVSFLWLAFALAKKIIYVQNNFYIWKYNKSSVTRMEEFTGVRDFAGVSDCYLRLAQDIARRGETALFETLVATVVATSYITSTSSRWYAAPKEYKEKSNQAITAFLKLFYPFYQTINEDYRRNRYDLMLKCLVERSAGSYENIPQWAEAYLNEKYESEILIIGYNELSKRLEEIFKHEFPSIYAPDKYISTKGSYKYKVAFICDGESKEDIEKKIQENDAEIYIIKSTVLPGTTEALKEATGKRVIFSPEYYDETQHCNNCNFDFTVLGGDKEDCIEAIQQLQKVYDERHQFKITDSKTAELVKHMENSYLATKASFCNQFYKIAEQLDVSYEELRELFVLDPRVDPSHTFVYKDKPYWDSQDVSAVAEKCDATLLKSIIEFNEECKGNKKESSKFDDQRHFNLLIGSLAHR